ncbi:MAG: helix-turn-helix domain-containing protein [Prochlorococcaceae cyanobacterium]
MKAAGRAASGLPERTLKQRFRNAAGIPLIDYLQNLRVEHGKRLLGTTDLPLEEIGAASGYGDARSSGVSFSGGWASHPVPTGGCSRNCRSRDKHDGRSLTRHTDRHVWSSDPGLH